MKKWKLITGLSAMLICGIIIGITGTLWYVKNTVTEIIKGDYQKVTGFIVNRLESRLDLTPAQTAAVKQIIETTKDRLIDVRKKIQPEVDGIVRKAVFQIDALLERHQKEAFIEFLRRHPRFREIKQLPPGPSTGR